MIYEPRGRAREYFPLALNLYNGCEHSCTYCYARLFMKKTKENYFRAAPKANAIERTRKSAKRYHGDPREICLSFIGDVYQPAEMTLSITREAIKILIENDLAFSILTKGGMRASRDFDLLGSFGKARFGTTLVFLDQGKADYWEPKAAPIRDRIEAIREARKQGIKTWVSLEPVIDREEALMVIRELHPIVDMWKVGKANYIPLSVDWLRFRSEVTELFQGLGADYFLKDSLKDL